MEMLIPLVVLAQCGADCPTLYSAFKSGLTMNIRYLLHQESFRRSQPRFSCFSFPRHKFWRLLEFVEEVERAAQELLEFVEAKRRKDCQCIVGLDIEWKPTFKRVRFAEKKITSLYLENDAWFCGIFHERLHPNKGYDRKH